MSTPAERANLARIRDNQRRSRARRKEYLQELERRLRLVELQGIEASAEIQAAARKVADENKKLRTLLNKHGINDDSIDTFLDSGLIAPPDDPSIAAQYHTAVAGNSVKTLEQLLGPRRPTCIEPGAPLFPIPAGMSGGGRVGDLSGGRDSRETSVTSISTIWDNASGQHGRPVSGSMPSQAPSLAPQPPYMTAPTGSGVLGRSDVGLQSMGSILESHRPSHPDPSTSSSHADRQQHHAYGYDMHMMQNQPYDPIQQRRPDLSAHQYPVSPGTGGYIPTTTNSGDAITSAASSDNQHMRGLPILDCEVDNVTFNQGIDRYTSTTLGM